MISIDPKKTPIPTLHQYIIGSIAPRPIAFVSTINEEGLTNLAPYSFFNAFSSNPPILVFSSNRKVKGNTTKDTLKNVQKNGEVVINVVTYSMVQQMALASIEYPEEVSEFDKAGFTPIASDLVKPYRVKESPVQMECKVKDIITLGEEGGAGHLVICEILRMHIKERILNDEGKIIPQNIDLVGRMGRAYYCRASGSAVFPLVRAVDKIAIGIDSLPEHIRKSEVLTGSDLGKLGGLLEMPSEKKIRMVTQLPKIKKLIMDYQDAPGEYRYYLHQYVRTLIYDDQIELALCALLSESVLESEKS